MAELRSNHFGVRIRRGREAEDVFGNAFPQFCRLLDVGHEPDFFSHDDKMYVQMKDGRNGWHIQQMSFVGAREKEEKYIRGISDARCVIIWWKGGDVFRGHVPSMLPIGASSGWWQQKNGRWRTPYFTLNKHQTCYLLTFQELLTADFDRFYPR